MESDGEFSEPVSVNNGPSANCAVLTTAMTKEATLFAVDCRFASKSPPVLSQSPPERRSRFLAAFTVHGGRSTVRDFSIERLVPGITVLGGSPAVAFTPASRLHSGQAQNPGKALCPQHTTHAAHINHCATTGTADARRSTRYRSYCYCYKPAATKRHTTVTPALTHTSHLAHRTEPCSRHLTH